SALSPVLRTAAPVRVRGSGDGGGGVGGGDASGGADAEEVERLRREIVLLDDRLRGLEEERERTEEFRRVRRRSGVELGRFVDAFVIGHSVNWQERTFLIDRGSADGIGPRSGVIAGGAVAGVVMEVGPHVARVAMATEPGVKVAARTVETRRSGLATGTGDGCELRYVERWAPREPWPREAESVVTSGRLGFFPPGFLLGRAASVGALPDSLHLRIALRPELGDPPEGSVWVLRPGPRGVQDTPSGGVRSRRSGR
ncbi:MAG: rod shape-determining protein MreC, partial [Planctomycetota bacterium]